METPDRSGEGYPEEAPSEVVADDKDAAQQEGGRDRRGEQDAPDNEDGTATGNPHSGG
jgi:hypothetical protein